MDFPSTHSKDYSPYRIVLLCYSISRNQGFMKVGKTPYPLVSVSLGTYVAGKSQTAPTIYIFSTFLV